MFASVRNPGKLGFGGGHHARKNNKDEQEDNDDGSNVGILTAMA